MPGYKRGRKHLSAVPSRDTTPAPVATPSYPVFTHTVTRREMEWMKKKHRERIVELASRRVHASQHKDDKLRTSISYEMLRELTDLARQAVQS